MHLTVTTRHVDPSKVENLKNYVSNKIKRLGRYIRSTKTPSEIKVILSEEKFRNTAEVIINTGSLKTTSTECADDMYTAVDRAIDGIIKQVKKHTQKTIKLKRRTAVRGKEAFPLRPNPGAEATEEKMILSRVRTEKASAKPMSVEEAVLQLGVSDRDFLVFRNSATGEINVVYEGKDGQIGLVEPEI